MKVYVLTKTSQLGQDDQPSSTVLGVFATREKAEQVYEETVLNELNEFLKFYE